MAMSQSQRRVTILVVSIAVLALPAYAIIGIVTAPFGLGLLMLTNSRPWILNLYPFLFAGTGNGFVQDYFIDTAVGLPLTIVQWGVIAWLAGRAARGSAPRRAPCYAIGAVLAFGIVVSVVLPMLGIGLVTQAAHT
jgi:hypothetical protein